MHITSLQAENILNTKFYDYLVAYHLANNFSPEKSDNFFYDQILLSIDSDVTYVVENQCFITHKVSIYPKVAKKLSTLIFALLHLKYVFSC